MSGSSVWDAADQYWPVKVPGLSNVRSIGAGGHHSLAATNGGNLLTWGWNLYGQGATGRRSTSALPATSVRRRAPGV